MTDKELRDAAVVELKKTTQGYLKSSGQPRPLVGAQWTKGLDLLAQIGGVAPPPPPPPPTGSKLSWAPPPLTNPLTVNVANDGSNREIYLNGRDAIVNVDQYDVGQRGGFTIHDAGNVHMIGGKVFGTRYAHYLGFCIQNPRGIVHIEGVDFAGPWLYTAMSIRTSSGYTSPAGAVVRLQNCRIEGNIPPGGSFSVDHPDTFQFEGNGVSHAFRGQVQLDRVTHLTCNTGFNAGTFCSVSPSPTVLMRRNNFRKLVGADGTKLTAYLTQWYRNSFVATLEDVWGEVGSSPSDPSVSPNHHVIQNCVQPTAGSGRIAPSSAAIAAGANNPPGSDQPTGGSDSISPFCEWPATANLFGKFRAGIPSGGDFCKAGVPGSNYQSPGYEA